MKKAYFSLLFAALFLTQGVWATVKPASIFGDFMVLQRNTAIPVWGTANAGEKVTVVFNAQKKTTIADLNGNWKLDLVKQSAGGPYTMLVTGSNELKFNNVYVGEVWLCAGQSNMDMTVAREDRYWCGVLNEKEEVAAANYPTIRVFDVAFNPHETLQQSVNGKWEIVSPSTVGHLSAAAYFFARDLQRKLKVPIGLITTAYGASTAEAWIRKEALEENTAFHALLSSFEKKMEAYREDAEAQKKFASAYKKWMLDARKAKEAGKDEVRSPKDPDPSHDQHNPYVLWNGMVAPLAPYAIRGAIWYQGESNGATAGIYRQLMETLITDWRKQWGQGNFPFIYVQLANHEKLINLPVKEDQMVSIRHAQLKNLSIPNTAMVVAIDNADPDDPNNIHPKNKQTIGARLALAARGLAYREKITYAGPLYNSMKIEGQKILLHFKNSYGGLVVKGDTLKGFAIAGSDQKFLWANAVAKGSTVILSNPSIPRPVFVRYAWSKNPPANLYNRQGLPAAPFKTDE